MKKFFQKKKIKDFRSAPYIGYNIHAAILYYFTPIIYMHEKSYTGRAKHMHGNFRV